MPTSVHNSQTQCRTRRFLELYILVIVSQNNFFVMPPRHKVSTSGGRGRHDARGIGTLGADADRYQEAEIGRRFDSCHHHEIY